MKKTADFSVKHEKGLICTDIRIRIYAYSAETRAKQEP